MNTEPENDKPGISRRDCLKLSALALGGGLPLGGLATAGATGESAAGNPPAVVGACYPTRQNTQRYSYFDRLRTFVPGTPLEPDEMRITFLGSMIPPVRRAQQEMSVFVEVGWFIDENGVGRPQDQFVFDCGSGVCANYGAMGIPFGRMDKVFLCHLHGDHMSDLSNIYCFGPSADRKSPLYVWGPSASNITYKDLNKVISGPYDDGLTTYCQMLRAAMRWHSESFSFQTTSYAGYSKPTDWGITIPDPVMDPRAPYDTRYQQADYVDSPCDGYALVPIELTWDQTGVAYDNTTTGVKITHFPVVHCRRASIGYKLEWTAPNGRVLTMIYTSDTKPETISIDQAKNGGKGVDVLIHEMIVPPEVWAMKNAGLPAPPPYGLNPKWDAIVDQYQMVQNSSHTPQGAFGYLLSQIRPRPRLTVVTHFPVADDTVACAFNSVLAHCPDIGKLGERITWSFDLMVFRLSAKTNKILQLRAVVSDFGWSPKTEQPPNQNTPKYWTWKVDDNGNLILDEHGNPIPVGDPFAQIDMTNVIPAKNADGTVNYRSDGY